MQDISLLWAKSAQVSLSTITDRVRSVGLRSSTLVELIAIAVARSEADANENEEVALKMLKRHQGLQALATIAPIEWRDATGLDEFEVLRVQALIELGRRVAGAGKGEVLEVSDPKTVVSLLDDLRFEKREHFVALLLDAKNQLIRRATIHIGTLDMSLVGPREVFREAIRDGAASIIVAHNHPSGDPTPSPEDISVTETLTKVGKMLDIDVLDHVIIGNGRAVSLRQQGLM